MGILDFWFSDGIMNKRIFIITGEPGIGKTTILTKVITILRGSRLCVHGMLSREIRDGGLRVGFELVDLNDNRRGWLAHINQKIGPRVGKYRVNLASLKSIGAKAIARALENCNVVAIDEVGPMELFSEHFRDAVQTALRTEKPILAVVHSKAQDRLIQEFKSRKDAETIQVTIDNRDRLPEQIAEKILRTLREKSAP